MSRDKSQAPPRTTLQDLLRQKQVRAPLSEGESALSMDRDAVTQQLFNSGVSALKENQPCCAKRLFCVLLSIDPDHIKAKLNLSVALSQQKDFQGAVRMLEEVLRQDPENTIAKQNLTILRQQ